MPLRTARRTTPGPRRRVRAALVPVALLALAATGCATQGTADQRAGAGVVRAQQDGYFGTGVPDQGRPALRLTDTSGDTFDFRRRPADEITVVFFGYTHCPDVCPTTMADLAAARHMLPAEVRRRVMVTFVTEDPERDTPALLDGYLEKFDRSFVGLRGGNAETRRAMKELHIPPTEIVDQPAKKIVHPHDHDAAHAEHQGYGVDHGSVTYAFGPDGRTVLWTAGTLPRQFASDLTRMAG